MVSVMIKPVSGTCNLNCKYCFYNSLTKEREVENYGKMSFQTLENVIKKALIYASGDDLYLSFQGGEPLLAGLPFFYQVETFLKKYNVKNSNIIFAVQTNGTLINEEWCEFFKRNNCLVGVSLDGNEAANSYRVDKQGNASFHKVMDNISLLGHYGVDFNILTVITKYVATHIVEIYNFFKGQEFKYLQFTPCFKPYGNQKINEEIYMTGEEYGDFLIKLTRMYFNDYVHGHYISIRQLDNFVRLVAGKRAYQCGMNGACSLQFVIEANGTVYPCDFYALDEWELGNINDMSFLQLANSPIEKKFIKRSLNIDEKCKKCKYWALCKNGCMRERSDIDKCTAYIKYFDYMLPTLRDLVVGIGEE